eukprot:3832503-Amphidinium_carterae.1
MTFVLQYLWLCSSFSHERYFPGVSTSHWIVFTTVVVPTMQLYMADVKSASRVGITLRHNFQSGFLSTNDRQTFLQYNPNED